MDYADGAHIITAKKCFNCEHCKEMIQPKQSYFARVKTIVPNKQKEYKRYHLDCAVKLEDLAEDERKKIDAGRKQETLHKIIDKELMRYEYQGQLVSFPYNTKSSKSFIISLKDGQMMLLLLTSDKNKEKPLWLKRKLDFMGKINSSIYEISSREDFECLMQAYIQ